jgi:hypothetical protein
MARRTESKCSKSMRSAAELSRRRFLQPIIAGAATFPAVFRYARTQRTESTTTDCNSACPHLLADECGVSLHVSYGSWLCENAKTLNRDRRSCSSKTVLVAQQASGFNLEIELKNIILRRVSIFEFLHMG